jgi:hypothetical protein
MGTQKPSFDLDAFDLSSHEDSSSQEGLMMSMDYAGGQGGSLFRSDMRGKGVERYSTMSAQKSEGEIGGGRTESLGDISLGEIRVPGSTTYKAPGRHMAKQVSGKGTG